MMASEADDTKILDKQPVKTKMHEMNYVAPDEFGPVEFDPNKNLLA